MTLITFSVTAENVGEVGGEGSRGEICGVSEVGAGDEVVEDDVCGVVCGGQERGVDAGDEGGRGERGEEEVQ